MFESQPETIRAERSAYWDFRSGLGRYTSRVRAGFLELVQHRQEHQEEIKQLRAELIALATELASLQERIGCSSRNSSKPPPSNGPGFKPPKWSKGSDLKRAGQPGHLGFGPELLPSERVDEVVEHRPDSCRRCGLLLEGEDPDPCAIR